MKQNFPKGVESLINPIEVGSIHFVQGFNKMLPKSIQHKLMHNSAQKFPSMGFVVEPYSSFLFYKITDLKKATDLLPNGFLPIQTKIFDNDTPEYYAVFGSLRLHTSAFWGSRMEVYIIAEDQKTGLLSWVIVDYLSNTIGHDLKNGLRSPSATHTIITINHRGRLFVDIQNKEHTKKIVYDFLVEKGKMTPLDQRLWLEGNLSIGYGKDLSNGISQTFSLKFEPCEVEKALEIPASELNLETNNIYSDIMEETPSKIVCFPYAQHFISDSPGYSSNLKDEKELVAAIKKIDFSQIKTFSVGNFQQMIIFSNVLSFVIITILLFLLFQTL